MIKQIKHNRSKQKFDILLGFINKRTYFDQHVYQYEISSGYNRTIFLTDKVFKHFIIYLHIIKRLNIDCGLEDDDIIRLLNDRFNTEKYKLVII